MTLRQGSPVDEGRLSAQEKVVLGHLADAWNEWCKLPKATRREDDNEEFCRAIHAAQSLVALRVARRVDPGVWGR